MRLQKARRKHEVVEKGTFRCPNCISDQQYERHIIGQFSSRLIFLHKVIESYYEFIECRSCGTRFSPEVLEQSNMNYKFNLTTEMLKKIRPNLQAGMPVEYAILQLQREGFTGWEIGLTINIATGNARNDGLFSGVLPRPGFKTCVSCNHTFISTQTDCPMCEIPLDSVDLVFANIENSFPEITLSCHEWREQQLVNCQSCNQPLENIAILGHTISRMGSGIYMCENCFKITGVKISNSGNPKCIFKMDGRWIVGDYPGLHPNNIPEGTKMNIINLPQNGNSLGNLRRYSFYRSFMG